MVVQEEATTVRVRCRPQRNREGNGRCVDLLSGSDLRFLPESNSTSATQSVFQFDKVYGEHCSQESIFTDVSFVVNQVLDGYNGTIMAYGQTGSGKTHTLIGNLLDPQEHGIVPRAVRVLAQRVLTAEKGMEFKVRLSVVEIYCERVRDLLYPDQDNLAIKQDASRGVYVEGATEISVAGEAQIMVLMQQGLAQRAVGATHMNAESSRSHCIVTMVVEKTSAEGLVQSGKLVMVDLAGSERSDRTGASGSQLTEGSQINKSLSCLANVIFALTDDKVKHIPYRDSKLTRVLQDSLGGSAKTVLLVCCSSSMENSMETLSSLRFGSRSRGMTSHVVLNTKVSIPRLQQQLELLKSANAELTRQLALSQQQHAPTPTSRHQPVLSMSGLHTHTDPQGSTHAATATEPHAHSASNSRAAQLQPSAAAVQADTRIQASSRPAPEEPPPASAPPPPQPNHPCQASTQRAVREETQLPPYLTPGSQPSTRACRSSTA
ncbi:MAG: hypothetical protein WDW36_004907 [Sanguina aurantia]